MDAEAFKLLVEVAAGLTAQGVLLWAWMLERKNVDKERERADRHEAAIIRFLEALAVKNGGTGI